MGGPVTEDTLIDMTGYLMDRYADATGDILPSVLRTRPLALAAWLREQATGEDEHGE